MSNTNTTAIETTPKASDIIIANPARLNVGMELSTVADVKATLPELMVLKDIYVEGEIEGNVDNHRTSVKIDNGYRMAGHIVDGEFKAVPWMKSEGYQETSHPYVLETICDNLDKRGLKHSIWKNGFSRNFGVWKADILLDQPYKVAEDAFENSLAVRDYNDVPIEKGLSGVYQPCITLKNSFFGASTIEFALIRIICANGMRHIAEQLKLGFVHIGGDVISNFSRKSDIFLDNIFTKKTIENIMMNFQEQPVLIDAFLGWMIAQAGPRTTDTCIETFNLGDKQLMDELNMWIAYNIMTYAASNIITSSLRQNRMYKRFQAFQEQQQLLLG